MRKASMLWLVLLAFAAWAVAQSKPQVLSITHGPVVEEVTSNSATVAWTTNVPGSAVVYYGTNTNPSTWTQTAEEAWGGQKSAGGTTHRVVIKNLQPNSTYYAQVASGQGQGTGTGQRSGTVTIKTPAPGAPAVHFPYGR